MPTCKNLCVFKLQVSRLTLSNKIEQMKKEMEAEVKQAKNLLDDVAQSGNKVFNSSFPNLNNVSIK